MRFLRPKSPFKASVTNATGTVRKKDKGDLQDSCSTLGLTKNAIDEKLLHFSKTDLSSTTSKTSTIRIEADVMLNWVNLQLASGWIVSNTQDPAGQLKRNLCNCSKHCQTS